ncbi:MAG TPA: hypothetical protein VGO29_12740 [Solirubrobacteraceae bacterium]|jgi:hypothetical protein|nr:hypothetical protein [Solirubrobacteraceae bacterium]
MGERGPGSTREQGNGSRDVHSNATASARTAAQLTVSLTLDSDAPRAARKHVETVDRPSPDLRDAVVLLTSELVSLAVRRCQFAGAAIDLRVSMPADVVRVEIRAPRSFLSRFDETSDSDYALVLIRRLADRWSLDGSGDIACMWFEIDRR